MGFDGYIDGIPEMVSSNVAIYGEIVELNGESSGQHVWWRVSTQNGDALTPNDGIDIYIYIHKDKWGGLYKEHVG
jgi:hypothetical protein